MREGQARLAGAGEDDEGQRSDESQAPRARPDLVEHEKKCEAGEEGDQQRKDLPEERLRGDEACGDEEDRSEKWAKAQEGWYVGARAQKIFDPLQRPIVPVITCPWIEQSVGHQRVQVK